MSAGLGVGVGRVGEPHEVVGVSRDTVVKMVESIMVCLWLKQEPNAIRRSCLQADNAEIESAIVNKNAG